MALNDTGTATESVDEQVGGPFFGYSTAENRELREVPTNDYKANVPSSISQKSPPEEESEDNTVDTDNPPQVTALIFIIMSQSVFLGSAFGQSLNYLDSLSGDHLLDYEDKQKESSDVLQFDGEEEQSLRRLLKSLAEWYPRAPQLQGNLSLIARIERDLPVVYGKIEDDLPFDISEDIGKRPTELPRWEKNGEDGTGFYYYGEPFEWRRVDQERQSVDSVKTGQKLPFGRYSGKGSERGKSFEFLQENWEPWTQAGLLTQNDLRGEKGLDNKLFSALSNKFRSKGKEGYANSGDSPLRDILPDRKSHNRSELKKLEESPDFEPTRREMLRLSAIKDRS